MDKKRPTAETADQTAAAHEAGSGGPAAAAAGSAPRSAADGHPAATASAAASASGPMAPLLSLARAGLEEYRVQAERWMEYGAAQMNQSLRAMQQAHGQLLAASLAGFATVEKAGASAASPLAGVASLFGGPGGFGGFGREPGSSA